MFGSPHEQRPETHSICHHDFVCVVCLAAQCYYISLIYLLFFACIMALTKPSLSTRCVTDCL